MTDGNVIDQPTFAKLVDSVGGGAHFVTELIDSYLNDTPNLFTHMRRAAATGDAAALRRAAHSLKSGSASFGALDLAEQCREIEEMAKQEALAGVEARIEAASLAYEAVASALRARRTGGD